MKLRNKKTGEIGTLSSSAGTKYMILDENGVAICGYKYLKDLCLEWHDYEEPKGYWFIDCAAPYPVDFCEFNEDTESDREIGNYFETKEEAEKAVEKLKSWKRLKDNGFKFYGYGHADEYEIEIVARWDNEDIEDDLNLLFDGNNLYGKYKREIDLLFGGEE